MSLAANESAPAQVRAIAFQQLSALHAWAGRQTTSDESLRDLYVYAAAQIKRFEDNPKEIGVPKPAEPSPGQPIGWE
ncbi:MAG: hypothetical protein LAP38_18140 [Acidobacteriia bacterium]|nr:hypothetical protein [Terriglobia bacterium]